MCFILLCIIKFINELFGILICEAMENLNYTYSAVSKVCKKRRLPEGTNIFLFYKNEFCNSVLKKAYKSYLKYKMKMESIMQKHISLPHAIHLMMDVTVARKNHQYNIGKIDKIKLISNNKGEIKINIETFDIDNLRQLVCNF